jgi:hypothetical protein
MDLARLLSHPKVSSLTSITHETKQSLALVFIKAFDDGGNSFPIDFDEVWSFLEYSSKSNALQKLKRQSIENTDYIVQKGVAYVDTTGLSNRGSTPDRYFLTTQAFEFFALSTSGAVGQRVRSFFIAIRDAWLESQTAPLHGEQPSAREKYELEREKLRLEGRRLDLETRRLDEEAPAKRMCFAQQWRSGLEEIGAFTVTDLMTFQGIVRDTARGSGGSSVRALEAATTPKEYTLSEFLQHEHNKVRNCKELMKPGKALAEMYRHIAGKDPSQKLQEVNGRQTYVKSYTDAPIPGTSPAITGFDVMLKITQQFNLL